MSLVSHFNGTLMDHTKGYKNSDIDIEYCEQVEQVCQESSIIQFKHLPAVPKALCMNHYGPYDRFYQSYAEAFAYMEEHGYAIADHPRTSYVDGIWMMLV